MAPNAEVTVTVKRAGQLQVIANLAGKLVLKIPNQELMEKYQEILERNSFGA